SRQGTGELWVADLTGGAPRRIFAGDAVQPSWSPGGQRIAFWGLRGIGTFGGGQRDLWTVRADGSDPVRIMDDLATDWNPVWSPDGRWLYFVSDQGGSMNLWRVPIDEASGRPLGAPSPLTTPSRWSGPVSVSRDGRALAYASVEENATIQRVAFDPAAGAVAGAPATVIGGSSVGSFGMDLSPDGRWIAFSCRGQHEDICLVGVDGSGFRKLTDDAAKDRVPRFSPDGEQIAFYSPRGGRYAVWSMRTDGSGLGELVGDERGDVLWFGWSPEGRRGAARVLVGETDETRIFDLGPSLPAREGTPLPPMNEQGETFLSYAWSPDGRRLLGTARRADSSIRGLFLYELDTRRYRVVPGFEEHTDIRAAAWMRDSRRLLVGDGATLWLADSADGSRRELVSGGLIRNMVAGDEAIYFIDARRQADLWLARLDGPADEAP
ncbi:MAG TPA: hypothetical protein VMT16_05500, partial [Thermoanaerobaculia bacterium]|nr:hypothetical protein [Thermoanaerobaculia bacterium]